MSVRETEACFHCGEPVRGRQRWTAMINGEEQPMCCPGCKAVAETIMASGLKDYYRHRTELPEPASVPASMAGPAARDTLTLYDSPAMQSRFVAHHDTAQGTTHGTTAEATLIIEGITCAACAWLIEHRLAQLKGVISASLNLSNHRLVIRWEPEQILLSAIFEAIWQLGYKAAPFSATADDERHNRESKAAIRRLAVSGIGMMQVMMLAVPLYVGMAEQYEVFVRFASMLLTTPVVLYGARPFFDAAIRDLRSRHLTMDVPVSLAILLAFCASIWSTFNQGVEVYFDSVCMFTFLLLLGRFLEMRARHRMGNAGNNLLSLLPNVACRLTASGEEIIPVEEISTGDRLKIRPGQPIPADGLILCGESAVDEAALTGEYMPISKVAGDTVIGGTVNCENPLEIEVTATGASARLSAIVRLMDRAQQEKPRIALLADRIASRFVAAVLVISGSVFTYWTLQGDDHAFFIALSVLVVTCPCALSLATPTALTATTTALRERGLLISKGHVLETLNQVNRVVFDKTGTLTEGHLQLEEVRPFPGFDENPLYELAAALEQDSAHPIARAFSQFEPATVSDIRHHTSQGVSGTHEGQKVRFGRADFACSKPPETPQSETGQWLLLSVDDQPAGWFLLNDTLRRTTPELIAALQQQSIAVVMLTGDPGASAPAIAAEAGIREFYQGLSAEQKLEKVRGWQAAGDTVLMVGDGINDVPVLAGADVSLAVSDATDLAKTNADALLISGQMTLIRDALGLAKRTRIIIRENILWALVYNLIALPLAAAGLVPPWAAAIGMSFSSLLVVLNALRLTRLPKHVSGEL